MLALLLAIAGGPGDARAATGTATAARAPEGYVRLTFAFDQAPKTDVRLSNGVLVVNFGGPVQLETAGLTKGLGDLVGVVRRDPDGSALRMALNRAMKLNVIEAGETLYVDLLPPNWAGMPPGPPKEALAALGQEARAARAARIEAERRRVMKLTPLTVQGATNPTFRRLVFKLDDSVPADLRRIGDMALLTIGAPLPFDLAAAKARLPAALTAIGVERSDGAITVTVPAPKAVAVRGFREDGSYILDIDRAEDDRDPSAATVAAAPVAASHDEPEPSTPASAPHAEAPAPAPERPAPVAAKPAARPLPSAAPVHAEHAAAGTRIVEPAPAAAAVALAASAPAPAPSESSSAPVKSASASAALSFSGESIRIAFPFGKATAAAVALRGRTLWAVFDDVGPIAVDGLVAASRGAIEAVEPFAVERGQALRMRLREPRFVTAAQDGGSWVVSLGDDMVGAAEPVRFAPDFSRAGRAALAAKVDGVGTVRRLADPEVGDELIVATLQAPARGALRPQAFVELTLLPTAHGVVVAPLADDVRLVAALDDLRIERDAGLALSRVEPTVSAVASDATPLVLGEAAAEATAGPYLKRERALLEAASLSSPDARTDARVALARFYLLRGMAADAKAVLDAAVGDDPLSEREAEVALLRGAAAAALDRPKLARAILSVPALAMNPEAALWRAQVEWSDGRPEPARAAFRQGRPALGGLPPAVRARFVELEVELALDAGDAATAAAALDQLDVLPALRGLAAREVLRGRVLAALDQPDRAFAAFAVVARGPDPIAAAEAELRQVELGLQTGKTPATEGVAALERLVTGWRGDWIEAEALAKLSGLYADAERWRDAFSTLKTAVQAFPDADETRALQDRMQERFTDLFLGSAVDRMPKLDALALFYDFQELSPTGRRGDELARRLADKLVEVDLLDQAADLLEYQVDHRLTGAARAQVASRAALVQLMNGRPADAVRLLQKTRQADLPASLVRSRLLLEARALAQTGRPELALEMAEGLEGRDGARLKADILWSANRWREAGEALEASLGAAWRAADPLDTASRADVMRVAIALSLADDALGLDRIRQKFAPKMADSRDAQAFEIVTAPIEARGEAFREIARSIAATSLLEGFLKEYRSRDREPAKPGADQAADASVSRPG
ncbi:hypothetical protein GCM10008174_11600 [Methylopila turkensis]|uniref:Tetratricopeptide repeat protein n=1 Tax=Methylopila turkensis TaxID=1437816 RepID=A0A9W6N5Q5_9HYPH|nr:hypothetical protein GCM10008174_11600 [Methylopila turkensis]